MPCASAPEQVAFRDELIDRLVGDFEAEFPPDVVNRYPPLPVEKWAHRVGALEALLAELVEKHRKRE